MRCARVAFWWVLFVGFCLVTAPAWWWSWPWDEDAEEQLSQQEEEPGPEYTHQQKDENEDEDEDEDACNFWNGTHEWSLGLCSHFAISRLGGRIEVEAVERAVHCAARHATDCVLAPEVGVGLPAVFLYDASKGMRLLLAPRLLEPPAAAAEADAYAEANVRVHDPSGGSPSRMVLMRNEITVEYLTTATKTLQVETLRGADAYCVQLVRRAISQACWDALE